MKKVRILGIGVAALDNQDRVTERYPIEFTKEELDYIQSYQAVSVGRCASVALDKIRKMKEHGIDVCYDFHENYIIYRDQF